MTRSLRRALPALALSTALVLSACASDDGDVTDTSDSSTEAGSDSGSDSDSGSASGSDSGSGSASGSGSGSTVEDASTEEGASGEAATEVTVTHAQGETVVPVDPETVVVFDLGVLDTLTTLGIQADGVPALDLRDLPERFDTTGAEVVGSLFEPDYEAVNALDPDLIIVGGRSSAVYAELAEIAPTIDLTVDDTNFVASFSERTAALGPIFGIEDQITAELLEVSESARRVAAMAAEAGPALILMTSGGEISAYGPGSRFGLIHDVLGVPAAIEDVEAATHGDAVSFEFVLEADPAHLYVLDRDAAIGEDGQAAEAVLDNELVRETTAWANDDVHYLDSVTWYLAPNGLGSVQEMVAEIEASLA